MDFYKWKWKMGFRVRKVKACFKLTEYNLRKKLNLEGDDEFYYHLQRNLLRDLIRTPAEHEYLEEHGLLPEEPEESVEPMEEEMEPGLLRELGLGWLITSAMNIGDTTYIATEWKEYEDRASLKVAKVGEDGEPIDHSFTFPQWSGERCVDFTIDDVALCFDREELRVLLPEET